MNHMKSVAIVATTLLAACSRPDTTASFPTEDDAILHAWSWSFNTIADNMHDIAEAGYAYVQTSPANTCYVGEGGGMALYSQPGDSISGKWYYYYQPTDWKIGNYMLGSRDDFKAMTDSASKYGVKVIVDVLPNHTAVDTTAVSQDLNLAAGGHDKLYHANGLTPIEDYNDRYQCTTGEMGGLPDVNTENPAFQEYYMDYVNDLLACGARGFRYDTAKHIGLPSDPLDSAVIAAGGSNNFWDIFTGRTGINGKQLAVSADSLFIYGEVLQDRNVKETEYAEYMPIVASNYGHALRTALATGNFYADSLLTWHSPVAPDRLVTWVESHDTYCNAHESAGLTDEQIRTGWVFLVARAHGTPLFFSRPMNSTRENFWGDNRIGARGNDEFKHPEVVAANKFRRAMSGQPERIFTNAGGTVVEVTRGSKGAALINLSDDTVTTDMETTLSDGTYADKVYGTTFTVSEGMISGSLAPHTTYIIY